MVELDGLIYVLGGENEATELTAVEVFDPHFNTWKPQTSMTMVRSVRPQHQNPPRVLVSGHWVGLGRCSLCWGVAGPASWFWVILLPSRFRRDDGSLPTVLDLELWLAQVLIRRTGPVRTPPP